LSRHRILAADDSIVPIRRRVPRPAILGVKEYVKTAPDMAVYGAVEFARNLHATVIRRRRCGASTKACTMPDSPSRASA
jgi:hypothetical protein